MFVAAFKVSSPVLSSATMSAASSRRSFLKTSATLAAAVSGTLEQRIAKGKSMNTPIGLQLYTVGKEMDADPFGTLKQVAAIGYKTVELSPMSKVPLADLRKGLDDVGLKTPAGHYLLPD